MSQQLQELINKIKTEAIEESQKKAKDIEAEAQKKAHQILVQAKKQSEGMIAQAKEEISKTEHATRLALTQASRSLLLSLRKEIENILQKLIKKQVSDALTSEKLSQLIETIVKKFIEGKAADMDIQIALSQQDFEKLKNGFMLGLQGQLRQPIQLKSSEDISRGLTISFDAGKSSFDFSDASLAEYLSQYLNPQIAALVNEATK